MFKKAFGVLQKVGKALMLPVAILPAAGILLAIGTALQNPTLTDLAPFLTNHAVAMVANIMAQAGGIIFSNLALLFAVGVAVGLAGGEGVAGLAAIVGYSSNSSERSKHLCICFRYSNPANRCIWRYYRWYCCIIYV
jgi:PTS system D-glucosamine-specific IIC component